LKHGTSVADPGCLSRILDPDFYPSRIPDLRSRISDPGSSIPDLGSKNSNKREGLKKITNFTNIANYFSFLVLKKKIWANFQRIIELFTQKTVNKLSKIWVWDPGSGKNLFRIRGSKRHRIPDPDPQHCIVHLQKPYVLTLSFYHIMYQSRTDSFI
jgi:hypothetical protein